MQERYIATLDLGSYKTALCVAKITGADTQILYYNELPSEGVRYSYIYNPKKAASVLKRLITNAEAELGIKILKLLVALPRFEIRSRAASAQSERSNPDECISQEEIDFLKESALSDFPLEDSDNEEVYGSVVQSFSADELIQQCESDVIGATAAKLDGNFKFFIGSRKASRNIDIMLNELGLASAGKVFTPISTAESLLAEEERTNGVGLIEIGAGVSSVTIYHGGKMRYYYSIPFGESNITSDIRSCCGLTETLAENIKLAFGACMPNRLQNMEEKILRINDEETGQYDDIPVVELSNIIHARMEEILDALFYKIKESGYAERLRNGLVITGGGANLTNLCALIRDKVGCNVRIAYPRSRNFSASGCEGIKDSSAVAIAGMILEAKDKEYINCIVDNEPYAGGETAAVQEEADDEDYSDTVFAGAQEIEKPKPKAKTKPKKSKDSLKNLKDKLKVTWMVDKAKEGLEFIGGIYDGIEKEEE